MSLIELSEALQAGLQAMSNLEIIAVLLSALAVWLTVRQNPLCWPLGLVSVLLYAWVFFEYKLYATVGLQFVFAASQIGDCATKIAFDVSKSWIKCITCDQSQSNTADKGEEGGRLKC